MNPSEFFKTNVVDASHKHPVVALIWGDNCVPCARLKPKLVALATEKGLQLRSVKAELESRELLTELRVRAVPTVLVFNRGVEITRFSGDKTPDDLHSALARAGAFQLPLL